MTLWASTRPLTSWLRDTWDRRRHDWWFRWAHHPLCARFREEVLRIGRVRVCRSCALLYAGLVAFVLLPLSTGGLGPWLLPIFYGSTAVVLIPSHPRWYHRYSRGTRDLLRFAAGVWIALLVGLFIEGWYLLGFVNLAAAFLLHRYYGRVRGEKQCGMCDGCPELAAPGICSGYREQATSLRELEEQLSSRAMGRSMIAGAPRR